MASLKTNLLLQYETDKDKEEKGVWVSFENGIEIRIRRLSSQASMNARKEAEKPYALKLRAGKLPDEVAEEIAVHQVARGVIADWKGITEPVIDDEGNPVLDEEGNPKEREIPYSGNAAYEILKDDALREFRNDLVQIALDRDVYKANADKDALGN